jgi:hypothetical protein
MTRFLLPGLLSLSLAACGGNSQQADLKCWAAATLASKARPDNADLQIMMAYYMGRLDAGDPEGKWTESGKAVQQDVGEQTAQFETLMNDCAAPLRQSLARQVASLRD